MEGPIIQIDGKSYHLVNMTPHPFVWYKDDDTFCKPLASYGSIRLTRKISTKTSDIVFGSFKTIAKHNEPWNGFTLQGSIPNHAAIIVSMPVAEFLCKHKHFLGTVIIVPDSGPKSVVRNNDGQICGVKKIIIYRK